MNMMSNIEEVMLVIDESGAKGYSDNTEQHLGEFGVMAGYFFPKKYIEEIRYELTELCKPFQHNGKKLHMSELTSEERAQLTKLVYSFIQNHKACWIYESIYVEGFHKNVSSSNEIYKNLHSSRKSKIKISYREENELLHAELFYHLSTKAIAFCIDYVGSKIKLNIITDRVDKSIVSMFENKLNQFLRVGQKKQITIKGFNTETQEIVKENCEIQVTASNAIDLSGIEYIFQIEDSPLTIVADVLVYNLMQHFKDMQKIEPCADLNCEKAIATHPLRKYLYGIQEDDMRLTDSMYAHPLNK